MITLIQKDGIYAQSANKKNRWFKTIDGVAKTQPGRNCGIEIEEDSVRQLCIIDKVIEDPTKGIARIDLKKLELVNESEEWKPVYEVSHYVKASNYVNDQGITVPEDEALDENGNLKPGYDTDFDFYDKNFNRSNTSTREQGSRDFLERYFVTIPNSLNS